MKLRSGKILCYNIQNCTCEKCKFNCKFNIKNCGHKCSLEFTDKCCACSDKRTISSNLYPKYVDQVGDVNVINRSFYYCPSCRKTM